MNDITLGGACPACGTALVFARSLAPNASIVLRNRTLRCPLCGVLVAVDGGIQQGAPAPTEAAVIPLAGGDSGGVGALMLD